VQTLPITTQGATAADAELLEAHIPTVALIETLGATTRASLVVASTVEPTRLALGELEHAQGNAASQAHPWITACRAPVTHWVAFGTEHAVRVARVAIGAAVQPSQPASPADAERPTLIVAPSSAQLDVSLRTPIDDENPARDRVQLTCDDAHAWLSFVDTSGALAVAACDASACAAPRRVADSVTSFSMQPIAERGAALLLAFSRLPPNRELRVLRLSSQAAPLAAPMTPAACWEPFGGMCGVPTLLRDGQRVILAARDSADLLAIESSDGGAHFVPLSGLKVGNALDQSNHDPMQQHRLRKGLPQ
jgi:hypothetical protein